WRRRSRCSRSYRSPFPLQWQWHFWWGRSCCTGVRRRWAPGGHGYVTGCAIFESQRGSAHFACRCFGRRVVGGLSERAPFPGGGADPRRLGAVAPKLADAPIGAVVAGGAVLAAALLVWWRGLAAALRAARFSRIRPWNPSATVT